MSYYSQAGQDKWVHDIVGNKGFFVDIGAYDGVQTSNTYALELAGWDGICVEAHPDYFKLCKAARKCVCVNEAVTDHAGVCTFGVDRIGGNTVVNCNTLQGIIGNNKNIDYLSMDIEGHELTTLLSFPFKDYNIRLITIEHNLYCDGPANKNALFELLTANGFTRVKEDVRCLDTNPAYYLQPYEDWYENPFYNKTV